MLSVARGFLTGTVWGVVVGSAIAAGGSLYVGLSKSALPTAEPVDVPAGSGFNGARVDTVPTVTPTIEAPERPSAPSVSAPQPETMTLADSTTQTAQAPDVSMPSVMSEGDAPMSADPTLVAPSASESAPVLPNVQMEQPQAPTREAIVGLSQDPAQPILPEMDEAPVDNQATETAEISVPEEPETPPSLPTIGQTAPTEPTPEPVVAEPEEVTPDLPALEAFKMEPVETNGEPLFSVVFIDDGSYVLDIAALESLPFPVSFAVDAEWDGAADAQSKYYDAGYEVAALVSLPEEARGQDVETTLAASVAMVPKSLAFIEKGEGALQVTREATAQVTGFAKETGHGLVYIEKGLNSGVTGATKEGVPAITIYRDLDANNQDERTIRRFLDGAAFRAKQERNIVLTARLRPETLSALLLWALQDRAKTVAIVPLSQVMKNLEN